MTQQTKNNLEKKTSRSACLFTDCVFTFADGDEEKKNFSIRGYSGKIIEDHWFWDNLVFDLEGIKFASRKTPILEEHNRQQRIGFSTKQEIGDGGVVVEGRFLSNADARRIQGDLADGFPMQASLYNVPENVEYVEKGSSAEVNGYTLKGPGAIFRKSVIHEISMCTLGADKNTQAKAFADSGAQEISFNVVNSKESKMENKTKVPLSAETFAAEYPDLHGKVTASAKAEGEKEARQAFAKIVEACGDDTALAVQCFADGKSEIDALKVRNEKLADENKKFAAAGKPNKPQGEGTQTAEQEFSDEADTVVGDDGKKPELGFMEVAREKAAKDGTTLAKAMSFVAKDQPELHKKFRESGK